MPSISKEQIFVNLTTPINIKTELGTASFLFSELMHVIESPFQRCSLQSARENERRSPSSTAEMLPLSQRLVVFMRISFKHYLFFPPFSIMNSFP